MSHGGAAVSSLKSQRKRGLGDRFRGSARDKLPLPAAPLVASLVKSLRAEEKESKSIHPRRGGARAWSRESMLGPLF